MNDDDDKEKLPVHLIFGAWDYSKNKIASKPRVGFPRKQTRMDNHVTEGGG